MSVNSEVSEARVRRAQAVARAARAADSKRERGERIERGEAAHDARADRQAEADPEERDGRGIGRGYSSNARTRPSSRSAMATANGASFGVHEHVPVVERAGGEQDEREQPGDGPPIRRPIRQVTNRPTSADRGADQPPRLEQIERQHLRQQRGQPCRSRRRTCRD